MQHDTGRKRTLTRKQTVLIERAVLFVVMILAVVFVIFLVRRRPERAQEQQNQQKMTEQAGTAVQDTAIQGTAVQNTAIQGTAVQKDTYLFSFAGDCTIGSLLEWQGSLDVDFQSVVGEDYSYPFSGVREIFSADDFTIVNLEGTFTRSTNAVEKPYRFKADPAYVRVLTEGGVDAVSLANNHAGDFGEDGRKDTISTLDSAGIRHTDAGNPLIMTAEGGLKLGIVSYNTVDNYAGEDVWRSSVKADIDSCKSAGCDLIIGFMHWGTVEYLPEPEAWEVQFAHDMADWGCDLIVGGHAHILQRMEYYNDVPIFYSLGNFCYGGNTDPDDKDTVIVQARYSWKGGKAAREELEVIPCEISTRMDLNDYCPTVCEAGGADYTRIMEKLEWKDDSLPGLGR